jgi:hypothetical protein
MRLYTLSGVLILLSQIPAFAQVTGDCGMAQSVSCTVSTSGQSLQGVWLSQIALPGGSFVPFAIDIFHADGSHLGINRDPTHSAHVGVWLRVGDRKFVFSTTFLTHDDKGVFNGIVKARGVLTLSEDNKSYDGTVERVVMDTSGNELQVVCGIQAHSVDLELPRNSQ